LVHWRFGSTIQGRKTAVPRLRIETGGQTTYHPLEGDEATIGRGPQNTIVLADLSASSQHARLRRTASGWALEDLKSTNGTTLNGQLVLAAPLSAGDEVRIGRAQIWFEETDEPGIDSRRSDASKPSSVQQSLLQSLISDGSSFHEAVAARNVPQLNIGGEDAGRQSDIAVVNVEFGLPPTSARTMDLSDFDSDTVQVVPESLLSGESLAVRKLQLIQQVSEKLIRIFEPEALLKEILAIVIEQTGADRGLLCLLDDSRTPVPIAAHGMHDEDSVRISRTVLSKVLNGRQGVLIQQKGGEAQALRSLAEMEVQCTLCVPLWTMDRISGLISLDSMSPDKTFTSQDLELLMAVAHQAALGIERDRMSRQVAAERHVRDYLSKYIDKQIVEQISARADVEDPLAAAERKVTILFSDIVSFTKISEKLQPTVLAGFIREYLSAMTDIVFAHGGTIDKYIGDAVMALFGAPVTTDNAAESAVRAALAMRERIASITPPGQNVRLRVRIGINTGVAVVGNLGSDRRMEYSALGDAVNVASRLETFARPNEICVDDTTHAETKELFQYELIGDIDVKNRVQPVPVYKVIKALK
jgi:adenylate cyclase